MKWRTKARLTPFSTDAAERPLYRGGLQNPGRNHIQKGAAPPVDLKELHAKIGQLTLENDCLAGALNKAGLLSARK